MNIKYDDELATRRLDAYIEMLKASYGVDEYGLADMIGRTHQAWGKFRKAKIADKSTNTIFDLARMTHISIDWLVAFDEREGTVAR